MTPIASLAIVGSGVHALLAAFTLRRALPAATPVKLVLLPDGAPEDPAGESTTPLVLKFLCQTLGVSGADLHGIARPVWNLGAKYLWGGRPPFFRAYDLNYSTRAAGLSVDTGFLAAEEGLDAATLATALMAAGKLFPKDGPNAAKPIEHLTGMNFRPEPLAELLRRACKTVGVETIEGAWGEVKRSAAGVTALVLADGREIAADLWIDATGSAARLAGGDFISYAAAGFCTRAVSVVRRRGSEPIRPFTTFEALPAGYRWRVEHDDAVGMGLAWHPDFGDEETARALLLEKAGEPIAGPHFTEWRPGRRAEAWHGNVVALGDAAGFLDPLAGARLGTLVLQLHWLLQTLQETGGQMGPESRRVYNRVVASAWDEMRDFVALHYRFSGVEDSPFWRHTAAHAELRGMKGLVDLFGVAGPSIHLANCLPLWPGAMGIDSWIAALLGLGVPFTPVTPRAEDRRLWHAHIQQNRQLARQAVPAEICLAAVRRQHQPPRRPPPVEIF